MTNWIRIVAISAAGASGLFADAGVDTAVQTEKKAAQLEEKARRHEAKAEDLANRKGYNPMAQKWPAMVQGPIDRERQLAAKARHEAEELREQAAKQRAAAATVAE